MVIKVSKDIIQRDYEIELREEKATKRNKKLKESLINFNYKSTYNTTLDKS